MNARELIDQANELPIEERVRVVDSLLKSLNHPSVDIDNVWVDVARQRLDDLRSGRVQAISGDEVFAKLKTRFEK